MSQLERGFLEASQAAQARRRHSTRMRWLSIVGAATAAVILVAIAVTLATIGQLDRFLYRPLPMEWVDIPARN